jgi:tRNA modification GTPase
VTPPGRGAIATIGVRGPGAVAAVASCFEPGSGQSLASLPIGRAVFGRFRSLSGSREELVVGLVGADEVEVHCHGGLAAAEAILAALVATGCQRETWQERAEAGQRDPIAAAALIALAEARTERTAAILLDQYHGALRNALAECLAALPSGPSRSAQILTELLSRSKLGLHLTRPWRVVIAGAPNVGKSTLINALLGYQRAIVFDQPGTTRDVLTATTAIDGWPVELADTAGLRASGDAIEAAGVDRALGMIAAADLVIEVLDARAGGRGRESGIRRQGTGDRGQGTGLEDRSQWTPALGTEYSVLSTQYLSQAARPSPLVVLNKCDLQPAPADTAGLVAISAKTGQGIDHLVQAIAQHLVPSPPPRGAAVPFTDRQILALQHALDSLDRGDTSAAQQALQSLLNPDP